MKDLTWIIGKKFNELTVIEEVESHVAGHRMFMTMCSCGNPHKATWNNVSRGVSKRCVECSTKAKGDSQRVFDVKRYSSEYGTWKAMISRCTDHENMQFSFYGGRGIDVTEDWLCPKTGFLKFLEDMGTRPEGYTLDRIDVNKGYSKENCRWATMSVQNHNKRKRKDAVTSEFIGVCKAKNGWRVQLQYDGGRVDNMYCTEEDAAIAYDNYSELYYGDRPNGTLHKEVQVKPIKRGGITNDGSKLPWKVRITDKQGKRIVIGRYLTEEEAQLALKNAVKEYYGE